MVFLAHHCCRWTLHGLIWLIIVADGLYMVFLAHHCCRRSFWLIIVVGCLYRVFLAHHCCRRTTHTYCMDDLRNKFDQMQERAFYFRMVLSVQVQMFKCDRLFGAMVGVFIVL